MVEGYVVWSFVGSTSSLVGGHIHPKGDSGSQRVFGRNGIRTNRVELEIWDMGSRTQFHTPSEPVRDILLNNYSSVRRRSAVLA